MSTRLFLILALLFSALQGTLLPPVFAEGLLVVLLVFSKGLRRALPFLFLAGIIFDLFQLRELGITSLIFVTLGGVSWITRTFISPERGLFLTGGVLAVNVARSYFVFNSYEILSLFFISIISMFVFNILQPVVTSRKGFDI